MLHLSAPNTGPDRGIVDENLGGKNSGIPLGGREQTLGDDGKKCIGELGAHLGEHFRAEHLEDSVNGLGGVGGVKGGDHQVACLGGLVIHRAMRSDVTYAFLLSYAAILFGRAAWLGDPWAIPLKQLQSGALLLFAFFMISDPKTTPDSRVGRILFALLVAGAAAAVQFVLYRTNGLLWALALCSLATPLSTISFLEQNTVGTV